jgi:hypothetical protein
MLINLIRQDKTITSTIITLIIHIIQVWMATRMQLLIIGVSSKITIKVEIQQYQIKLNNRLQGLRVLTPVISTIQSFCIRCLGKINRSLVLCIWTAVPRKQFWCSNQSLIKMASCLTKLHHRIVKPSSQWIIVQSVVQVQTHQHRASVLTIVTNIWITLSNLIRSICSNKKMLS